MIQELKRFLAGCPTCNVIWVAYSGGMDSHVLLHAMSRALEAYESIELRAVHINHGLNKKAHSWEAHCQVVCAALQVPLERIQVDIKLTPGESVEALARGARYKAFEQIVQKNQLLVTAQHLRDQTETVLLQLFRGSGPKGLAAMPDITRFSKGYLARPLLNVPYKEIKAYAARNHIQWLEDDSNVSTRFNRNFIRLQVLPLLQKRWPGLTTTVARSARLCAESQQVLQRLLHDQLKQMQGEHADQLPIDKLQKKILPEQRLLIREWIRINKMAIPSENYLQRIIDEVMRAAEDANPVVSWASVEVRRFKKSLYIMRVSESEHQRFALKFSGNHDCRLPGSIGIIAPRHVSGAGIKKQLFEEAAVKIRFRRGGEKIQLHGHTRSLKKLLQVWSVPPWKRHNIPLVFHQDQLICVVGYAVADDARATGEEPGIALQLTK